MPSVSKSVLVPYACQQMFELVERVEAYPEFLPWCGGSVVHERSDEKQVATVRIAFAGLRQSFTTENRLERPSRIDMQLREGPFTRLDGHWHFLALGDDACKIEFRLEYAFAGGLVSRALGPVFDKIAAGFVDAFVQRAETLYG
jgi:ribosome-associated toxin RatA of RatAB toxin-antitoxin module